MESMGNRVLIAYSVRGCGFIWVFLGQLKGAFGIYFWTATSRPHGFMRVLRGQTVGVGRCSLKGIRCPCANVSGGGGMDHCGKCFAATEFRWNFNRISIEYRKKYDRFSIVCRNSIVILFNFYELLQEFVLQFYLYHYSVESLEAPIAFILSLCSRNSLLR